MNSEKFWEDLIIRNKSYSTLNGRSTEKYTYYCGCWTEWDGNDVVNSNYCPNHPEKVDDGRSDISISET